MAKSNSKVSETVIRRLPKYHRYLSELLEKNVDRISSQELSGLTGFTASQIRQDLNNFGGFGQQGYGYNVEALRGQIDKILGIDRIYKTIIVGAGRLGSVISMYGGFKESGFDIIALFDKDKDKVGTNVGDIPIYHFDMIEDYIKKYNVEVGIITVPKTGAQSIADIFVKSGIKGIWNFAPTDLIVPEDVVVESVRLNDSLLTLSYYLTEE
ncbi:MAG: redox-sensing transcriptional repressor Rex [Tissierellia bacterium]|nr:redox-sensing transcriptional repressor Rex [Tissierellia bacterium]